MVTYRQLQVGTFPSVTTKWIPKILKKMNEEYPGIEVSILEENYEVIQQLVLEGQLDCGFVADNPFFFSLSFPPLKKDKLLCIISAEHPLAQLNKVTLKVLNQEPFILPGKGGDIELKKFFKVHNITPNIRYEIMDTNQSIVAMVESNLGISILPQLLLNKISKTVITRKPEIDFSRMIGLINLKNPSPATNLFIIFFTSTALK
ncbi:LysR family transcriptional regulator substrate-binding protein [Psychrobacillus soli]|uniref:LysR family transcriptional regulator substrate-binding protein n=1 Tax=Psychrobacillus soli TaxID=1543965 RepID=A0A544SY48_9BACI|nr:LysR family transcriptional regulator substrate-binding protein [Psychrobacillus soli]